MLRLLAAGFVGYYIGKRTLPKAVEDAKALSEQVEDLLRRVEQVQVSGGTTTAPYMQ